MAVNLRRPREHGVTAIRLTKREEVDVLVSVPRSGSQKSVREQASTEER